MTTLRKAQKFPLLPVRDIVIFPYMMVPIAVGRATSLKALEAVKKSKDQKIIITAQKDIYKEEPSGKDLYSVGVSADIIQTLDMPDGSSKILIEGKERVIIRDLIKSNGYLSAEVEFKKENYSSAKNITFKAKLRNLTEQFEEYVKFNSRVDLDVYSVIEEVNDAAKVSDIIAGHMRLKKVSAQEILKEFSVEKRIDKLSLLLREEIKILKVKDEINGKVRGNIEKAQKKSVLSEQMKVIKKELLGQDEKNSENADYEQKIKKSGMSKQGKELSLKELNRLKKMMPFSPESTVVRTYIDWLLKIPWKKETPDNIDLKNAKKILESEHHGLEEAKDMILEHLAVSKLAKEFKSSILCFVGPPGTGKTSFGRSIAHAMGRRFTRVSLGGMRDEAEIRGHRRTYIGAMPGRIIQSIDKAGTRNPVFLLDEVDKMGKDFRGDPSSALLEALDPEQNTRFSDHYLEVDFDLSDVMFITTANSASAIPPALKDRMEVVKFTGYTSDEKIKISQKFLVPKHIKAKGLSASRVSFTDEGIRFIIDNYTREAGVRNIEREIAKVLRKIAREVAEGKRKSAKLTENNIQNFLGVPKVPQNIKPKNDVGIATGLSWTEYGGATLSIEISVMPGDGKLKLTGKLGDVMKESAQAALSYVRANTAVLNVEKDFYKNHDIHVHVPAGAIPKEGPSAGITICTALISALLKKPVNKDVVMTGEITLSGKILEIGGFKEKILAAHRDGFKKVIFPGQNKKNIEELPENIISNMELIPVKEYSEVLIYAIS
ncbi:MAG: endopeptidase La [Elusimicrobia bacterium]|jgi:ATP-dependent Lon protease|nr:endopeptidase La [Elusimicrobiota bacterium]